MIKNDSVNITDVTLREYGQNIPAEYLHIFAPEIRVEIALRLIDAGIRNIEILSCVNPKISPAMNEEALKKITQDLGRINNINFITLVPNKAGYKNFLELGLGPDGYNHTMGIFFSAIEAHNIHPHHVSGEAAIANSKIAYDLGIRRFDSSLGGTGGCVTGAPGNQPTEMLVDFFNSLGIQTGLNETKIFSLTEMVKKELYGKISLNKD